MSWVKLLMTMYFWSSKSPFLLPSYSTSTWGSTSLFFLLWLLIKVQLISWGIFRLQNDILHCNWLDGEHNKIYRLQVKIGARHGGTRERSDSCASVKKRTSNCLIGCEPLDLSLLYVESCAVTFFSKTSPNTFPEFLQDLCGCNLPRPCLDQRNFIGNL